MKRCLLLSVLIGLFSGSISFAQVLDPDAPIDGVVKRESNRQRKAIPYSPLRESDVIGLKRVWRYIDLREKMNLPLYYPIRETNGMKSLADLLYSSITSGEGAPRIYHGVADDFSQEMTPTEFKNSVEKVDSTYVPNLDDPEGPQILKLVPHTFEPSRVKKFWIKEEWFFDKQRSVMECRIIGICPLYENEDKDKGDTPLFWLYFPHIRPLLAKNDLFNTRNAAKRMTFDDLFKERKFSSYITKEENVYDRVISEYSKGLDALLESERIKHEITDREHTLWEY